MMITTYLLERATKYKLTQEYCGFLRTALEPLRARALNLVLVSPSILCSAVIVPGSSLSTESHSIKCNWTSH